MSAIQKVLVLHGPNLNLLGSRETEYYGIDTLAAIDAKLFELGRQQGVDVETLQSNREYELIERLAYTQTDGTDFILINAAALAHTSIALRDTLIAVQKPFIEIHLSNIYAREVFRHHSFLSDKAVGVICGLGVRGYEYALQFAFAYQRPLHNLSPAGQAQPRL